MGDQPIERTEDEAWRAREGVDARGMDPLGRPLWVALAGLLLAAGAAAGLTAKVWRVTPSDGGPVYRVSIVDRVQSWMLHRKAMANAATGDDAAAVHGLRAAVANNPGDAHVLRDWIRLALSREDALATLGAVPLGEALLLLRVGGTNAADVELTMRLLTKLELRDEVVRLGEALGDRVGTAGLGLMAMAYFDSGDMESFDAAWGRLGGALEQEGELRLRREAWKAQWGPPGTAREGMARLLEAQADPATRRLALGLLRRVAAARSDMAEHERLLRMQMEEGSAGTGGIVEWWLLLAATGRLDAARRAAREVAPLLTVRGVSEARTAATGLMSLGLPTEAIQFLESAPVARHRDVTLWLLRADAFRALERWEDLGAFATGLIQLRGAGREAVACGMVLRAASEAKLGRPDMAQATVRSLVDWADVDGGTFARLAGWVGQAGLRTEALALMRRAEAGMAQHPGYWAQRTMMASASGDLDDMVESSRRALALAPGDPRLRNNHAAALVAARREPAEAVQLTLQNVQQYPLEPRYRVNHAFALLANDRVREARRALDEVAAAQMPPEQEARLHLAWMEVLLREGRVPEARQRMERIHRSLLLPFEEARLDELAGRL